MTVHNVPGLDQNTPGKALQKDKNVSIASLIIQSAVPVALSSMSIAGLGCFCVNNQQAEL
jgi:hypothetical protein